MKTLTLEEVPKKEKMKEASKQWKELPAEQKADFFKQAKELKNDVVAQQEQLEREDAKQRALHFLWEPRYLSKVQFQPGPEQNGAGEVRQVDVQKEQGSDVVVPWCVVWQSSPHPTCFDIHLLSSN